MAEPTVIDIAAPAFRPAGWIGKITIWAALRWTIILAVASLAIWKGLELRDWEYASTVDFRFHYDINNAWEQGSGVLEDARNLDPSAERVSFANLMRAYLHRFDTAMADHPDGDYQLDYPPARLLIMSIWVWHETGGKKPVPEFVSALAERMGLAGRPPSPAESAGPLLQINTAFELAAMAGAFMLARAVLKRAKVRGADLIALGPALLIWFNPAVLIDAHAWPQWDCWPLPFWLWAGYFAVTRRWLAAGLCLGLGAMFKGQIMLTMGFFVLWPLFQWRLRAVLDICVGILLGIMAHVWPWMLWTWAARIVFAVAFIGALFLLPRIRRGWRAVAICGVAGAGLLVIALLLGGNFNWWHVGFEYGARRWTEMNRGSAPNLAASLADDFGWNILDVVYTVNWTKPAIHFDITMQQLLTGIYGLALVLSAVGAARQDSRADARLLLAMATPWVVMFAFMPQMHERYLMWGAALTALAAAVSVGSTLLHLLVTFIACVPMLMGMPQARWVDDDYPWWRDFLRHAYDRTGWMTILLALIFVYLSLTVQRRRVPVKETSHVS